MSKTLKMSILLIIITLGILFLSQTSVNAVVIDSAETLKEAFEGKSANIVGTTITLTGDVEFKNPNWTEGSYEVEFDVVELIGDDYVLNLNGNTLKVFELYVNEETTLTINDKGGNGAISIGGDSSVVVLEGGKVIVDSGSMDYLSNLGEAIINNGHIDFIHNYGTIVIESGSFYGITQQGNATIKGGAFIADEDRHSTIDLAMGKTILAGGYFGTAKENNPDLAEVDIPALVIRDSSNFDKNKINNLLAEGYLAEYGECKVEEYEPWFDDISGEMIYEFWGYYDDTPIVILKDKPETILNKLAPNGVWTINSAKPNGKEPVDESESILTSIANSMDLQKGVEIQAYCNGGDKINTESVHIRIMYNGRSLLEKDIEAVWNEPNKTVVDKVAPVINKIADKIDDIYLHETGFILEDLYLINYLNVEDDEINDNLALNFAKDLIELTNGSNISYKFDFRCGDSGNELYSFLGGTVIVYYDGIAVDTTKIGLNYAHVIYVPTDTADTDEARIEAALKRIEDYLGTKEGISMTVGGTLDSITDEQFYWNAYNYFDETTSGTNYYNLKINGQTYKFVICKKDSSELETPKYVGTDVLSNISITSDNTTIPLDTAVKVNTDLTPAENKKIKETLGTDAYVAYDISLYSNAKQENITKLDNGEFLVSIPVPEILKDVKDEKITVYYINDAGEKDDCVATVKDGMATFKTKHFSIYAVAEKIDKNEGNEGAEGEKEEQTYKVIFKANGGKFRNGNETLTYEEWKYTDYDNLEKPTREGYKFLGYYTEEGILFDLYYTEAGVDRDMVLEAKWEELKDNNTGNTTDDAGNPQTGDVIVRYVGILVMAVIGILATMKLKNKKN